MCALCQSLGSMIFLRKPFQFDFKKMEIVKSIFFLNVISFASFVLIRHRERKSTHIDKHTTQAFYGRTNASQKGNKHHEVKAKRKRNNMIHRNFVYNDLLIMCLLLPVYDFNFPHNIRFVLWLGVRSRFAPHEPKPHEETAWNMAIQTHPLHTK